MGKFAGAKKNPTFDYLLLRLFPQKLLFIMKHLIPLLLLSLLLVVACRSTKKAYEKGDYERAVVNSVEKLRRSPNNKKARETIRKAYPALVDYYQGRIQNAKLNNNPLRWEEIVDYYQSLNQVYDEIQRSPVALKLVPNARSFQREYLEATNNAAQARYVLGMERLEMARRGDRESAKAAYAHFEKVDQIKPRYRDVEQKMFEARDLATLYVQIEPIPMHSRSLELSSEFFENQLAEFISQTEFSPFVRFFTPAEAPRRPRDPDQILLMSFDEFQVGQSRTREQELQRHRDSVVVGTVKIKGDSTVSVYGSVDAKVHIFTQEISSSGLLDLRLIDTRNDAILTQRKFPGTYVWVDQWGFFNGDERALSDEDLRAVRRSKPSPPPPPQQLFVEFTKPIFSQVTSFVRSYYRNY
jgi:tetratricopeptide (TPR) repeat protein